MILEHNDSGLTVDGDFPCAGAVEIRKIGENLFEVDFRPEEPPRWFQALLDELFQGRGGRGVPKEYASEPGDYGMIDRSDPQSTRSTTSRFVEICTNTLETRHANIETFAVDG